MIALIAAGAIAASPVTALGPGGPLAGTFIDAGKGAPVVVIIPGSGPTDRDGNNPLGVTAQPYRLLAEALAAQGVSTIRVDKRGMFGSKAAIANANNVTIANYASDAHAWARVARVKSGAKCAWLLGHSEGGLVALAAGQDKKDLCGIISVSGPGRKLGLILREQLRANPANAPLLSPAMAAIDELEAGRTVPSEKVQGPLTMLFAPQVQPFLIDLMSKDPARLAGSLNIPLLIVQGDKDTQVALADGRALAAAQPKAKLVVAPGVNHVLKSVTSDDRAANAATYADPSLPVAASIVEAVATFVKTKR